MEGSARCRQPDPALVAQGAPHHESRSHTVVRSPSQTRACDPPLSTSVMRGLPGAPLLAEQRLSLKTPLSWQELRCPPASPCPSLHTEGLCSSSLPL